MWQCRAAVAALVCWAAKRHGGEHFLLLRQRCGNRLHLRAPLNYLQTCWRAGDSAAEFFAAKMSLRNSLLVLLLLAAWPAEAQLRCATGDDACSRRGSGDGGGDLRRSSSSAPAARQLHAAAGSDGPLALDLGRAVVLHTQMGDIRIRLLERQAPRITQLVWDLAATRGCGAKQAYNCSFYR